MFQITNTLQRVQNHMDTDAAISPAKNIGLENVERYYKFNQIMYSLFWSPEALHYGFWDNRTKWIFQAVRNTNRHVCDCLEIQKDDHVLDAGCGVGGVSRYIAEHTGARVTGITLSEIQVKLARRSASHSRAAKRLAFYKRDFTRTQFADETFSKLFGIESVCHAVDKLDFLKEAYRVLAPGGRIAVVDGFLSRTDFDGTDTYIFDRFMAGWALPNLTTPEEFRGLMRQAGFEQIHYVDKLSEIRESIRRIYRRGVSGYPITYVLSRCGIIPKNVHGNTITAVEQKRAFDRGILTYGVFVAIKA